MTPKSLEAAAIRTWGDPDAFGQLLSTEEPDVLVEEKCSECERILSVPSRDVPFVCGACIAKKYRPGEDDESC